MAAPLLIRGRPPYAPVAAMLANAGLPVEDLSEGQLEHFFYAGSDASPTGLVGLEIYGADALLRSLVVEERERGQGAARRWCATPKCTRLPRACARSIF